MIFEVVTRHWQIACCTTSGLNAVQALSEATLDEVNEAWAGLGYYRRARFLLEGAQVIAARPGASMPRTAQDWLKIPGRCPALRAPASVCQIPAGACRGAVISDP